MTNDPSASAAPPAAGAPAGKLADFAREYLLSSLFALAHDWPAKSFSRFSKHGVQVAQAATTLKPHFSVNHRDGGRRTFEFIIPALTAAERTPGGKAAFYLEPGQTCPESALPTTPSVAVRTRCSSTRAILCVVASGDQATGTPGALGCGGRRKF